MPFNRPSLPEIQERIKTDIRAHSPQARPELRRSLTGILANAQAGGMYGLYGYLDYLSQQLFPDTAEAEHLHRWARIFRVPVAGAEFAAGDVIFTGTEGVVIPERTRLEASDGAEYQTDAAIAIAGGTATIAVTALVAGETGNRAANDELQLVGSLSGVSSSAVVAAAGLTGGADAESDERLRQRLLARIQRPPHGGSAADYERWALEGHPDVTRAWVYPAELGEGTVTVRIMTDEATADGTPAAEVVDTVQSYIESVRPVAAVPYTVAPVAVPLDFQISLTPDTGEVRNRIQNAIRDYLRRAAEPGATLYLSQLSGVIYVAAGESRFTLTAPSADKLHAANEIAILGAITWAV